MSAAAIVAAAPEGPIMARLLLLAASGTCVAVASAAAQDTTRISVDSSGAEADDSSSATRRCVAGSGGGLLVFFDSVATNLVKKDLNGASDVFLRDVAAGTTTRIVLDAGGGEPDGPSSSPFATPDGRFVAFQSDATDLVKGDKNGATDVFVLDRKSGVVERVSVADDGSEAGDPSTVSGISDDGRLVLFACGSDKLVGADGNFSSDLFVRDRSSLRTICVTRNPAGDTCNLGAFLGCISADGSRVAFESRSSDLVANDTNGKLDVFVHDVAAGTTVRGSLNAGDGELDADSGRPSLAEDGGRVAFLSAATNAHRDATNGVDQVFVRDLATGEVWLASRGVDGLPSDFKCFLPTLFTRQRSSGPVAMVAFWTAGTNLDSAGNIDQDAYVVELRSGFMQGVNVDSDGGDPTAARSVSFLAPSPDGDALVFSTSEDELVPGDGNGVQDVFVRGLQWVLPAEFGVGLAGAGGYVPRLTGAGGSCESGQSSLAVADGLGGAPGLLWVGFGATKGVGLFGGTFYVDFAQPFFTVPVVLDGPTSVGGAGELFLVGANVEDVGELSLFLQGMFLDARAIRGVSLSNALELAIDA